MNRRTFLQSALVLAAASRQLGAQSPAAQAWGGPVLDIHHHLRPTMDGNITHCDGAGVTKAVLLSNVNAEDHAKEVIAAYPGRFVRFASVDVRQPDAIDRLRNAVRNGAIGLGEIKSQVEAAGPEMQRVYALAAELGVPVTIHFQEFNQPASPGTYNTGLKKFDAMLKAFPKTTFIGEYPNLRADMSANSCNNFLKRDPEFAAGFLVRHQNKLMFGSDCSCPDGRGVTVRCVARDTLTELKKLAPADVFRKITWDNGTRLLKL
jgi:predicted TIM-barrel fold metal-dependent hydrolase